jgi:ATP-binding protein involved in chromosome partitioning
VSLKMYQETAPPSPLTQIKNIIAIAAGKGGVGKSSITVNLARALKKLGYRVGLLDADIYGPSARQMLSEDRLPVQKGDRMIPALSEGMQVISFAHFSASMEAAAVRAPIANKWMAQFLHQVAWEALDYLLIDFPPGTGDIQITLSQQANLSGAVMITTPQEVAVLDVRKAIHLFEQVKVPIIGIIENMSYFTIPGTAERVSIFGSGGGERLARDVGVPLLGQIPLEPALCDNNDRGLSIFSQQGVEAQAMVKIFLELAQCITAHLDLMKEEGTQALTHFELLWKEIANESP